MPFRILLTIWELDESRIRLGIPTEVLLNSYLVQIKTAFCSLRRNSKPSPFEIIASFCLK